METLADRLRATSDHLAREGITFVSEARDAGRGFVDTTRDAALSAVGRTRNAGGSIVTTARSEADAWMAFLQHRRNQLTAGVRHWVSLRTIEYRLLRSVHESIAELDGQLEGRLQELASAVEPAANGNGARGAVTRGAANGTPAKPKRLPIGNYDSLTAKEVVSRLDKLSPGQLQTVYEHERKGKQRQTVLRAAKQRLAN